jgi:predicted nuclease of predicted toxin-antitoxin system
MKFLANENIPFELIDDLRKLGYDILRVDEVKKGMRDHEVLDLSFKEGRILITFDKDFGKLAFKEKRKAVGIILLRVNPKSIQHIKDRILLIFEQVKDLEGKFIVLEENILRVREIKGDI